MSSSSNTSSASSRASSSSSSSSSSDTEVWTGNEGESSDNAEEVAAQPSLRGQTALVTASCPRQYLRSQALRKAKKKTIPEDFTTEEFLNKFRKVFDSHSNSSIEKLTCHDEPHKRPPLSQQTRETQAFSNEGERELCPQEGR